MNDEAWEKWKAIHAGPWACYSHLVVSHSTNFFTYNYIHTYIIVTVVIVENIPPDRTELVVSSKYVSSLSFIRPRDLACGSGTTS